MPQNIENCCFPKETLLRAIVHTPAVKLLIRLGVISGSLFQKYLMKVEDSVKVENM